ncbi:MAG: glycosyltransferase [Ignavibacterium sp.]|nr:glycosyltransferase [Ignavibacterium sp.]
MQIVVSIIISTRNRAKSLRQILEAIRKIEVPADMPTELILVDNASEDETSTIIRNWRSAQDYFCKEACA